MSTYFFLEVGPDLVSEREKQSSGMLHVHPDSGYTTNPEIHKQQNSSEKTHSSAQPPS